MDISGREEVDSVVFGISEDENSASGSIPDEREGSLSDGFEYVYVQGTRVRGQIVQRLPEQTTESNGA